ncbi:MAG: hypothetical protein K2L82_01065 [Lachnospiraceae bacterium]|nr:hypothetical protein [Lachnospiraceae bacterium]
MELGSEFHFDLTNTAIRGNTIYHLLARYNTFYTDYGRTAITLVYEHLVQISEGRRDRILLPSYICESVIEPFKDKNIIFYDLKENFEIEEQGLYKLLESGDFDGGVFFLMHYFGMVQPEETLTQIQILCKEHDIAIIEDTTHSIFTKERTIGDYCIASLRKWMPIPEGAVIYSINQLPAMWQELEHAKTSYKIHAMVLKQLFLGQADGYRELENVELVNEAYRRIFVNEEERIGESGELYAISYLSAFLLQCIDISEIRDCRATNYRHLGEELFENGISLYNWQENRKNTQAIWADMLVPFTALLYVEDKDRDSFRNYLEEHRIYCAVHWSVESEEQRRHANVPEWSGNLISIPIDQRYGEAHMRYLAEIITEYFNQ